MSLMLGDFVPDFTAESTKGKLNLYDYLGDKWGILFSHPADFTPVCTTELGKLVELQDEFEKRSVKVIALSIDSLRSHEDWLKDIESLFGKLPNFPIIADPNFVVSKLYDFVHPSISDRFTVRSVVIIGPDKKIKLTMTYPASIGRNFDEILRVMDAFQRSQQFNIVTPANWKPGDHVIIPTSVKTESIPSYVNNDFKEVFSYFRTVSDPLSKKN